MKKLIKIFVYCVVIFLILAAGIVFIVKALYPPEKLKEIAISKAGHYLKRQIDFENISIGFSGLKLQDFSMSEVPDFKKGTMLKAGYIFVLPKILPLLTGKVEMGKITLEGIHANLVRYKDGSFNFSDFMAVSETKKSTEKITKDKKPADISISKFVLTDSSVNFTDNMLNSKTVLTDINLTAKNLSLSKPFDLFVNCKADYKSKELEANAPFSLAALLTLSEKEPIEMAKVKKFKMDNSLLKLKMPKGEKLSFSVTKLYVQSVSDKNTFEVNSDIELNYKADFNLKSRITSQVLIELEDFNPDKIKVKINSLKTDAGNISAAVNGKFENLKNPKADLNITVSPFNLQELSKYIKDFNYNFPVPKTQISTKFNMTDNFLNINSLKIKPAQSRITANAVLLKKRSGWEIFKGASSFDINLDEFAKLSQFKDYNLGGSTTGKMAFKQSKGKFDYSGNIELKKIKLQFEKSLLENLNGTIKASKNQITAKSITGILNKSPFKTSLLFVSQTRKNKIGLDAFFEEINLDLILPPTKPKQKTKTPQSKKAIYKEMKPVDLNLKVKVNKLLHPNFMGKDLFINADMTGVTSKLNKANGTAAFGIKDGTVKSLGVISERSTMAKALLIPLTTLQKITEKVKIKILPDFNNISYSVIEGNYKFTNGYMDIIKSQLLSDAADVTALGSADFKRDALNMKINADVKAAAKVPLKFKVTGKISDPSVKLDVIDSLIPDKKIKSVIGEGTKFLKSLF